MRFCSAEVHHNFSAKNITAMDYNSASYVPLIFHAKIQPKISSGSDEEVDFVVFAIFSNSGHLGYST